MGRLELREEEGDTRRLMKETLLTTEGLSIKDKCQSIHVAANERKEGDPEMAKGRSKA